MPTKILLTGASGFIGGTVLTQLLKSNAAKDFDITALIRDEERASLLRQKLGLRTLVGNLDSLKELEQTASESDIVLDCANADHAASAAAFVRGLARRPGQASKVLIHISGAGSLTDNARGDFANPKVYSDEDLTEYRKISPDYVHRAADIAVLEGGQRAGIRSYVLAPPLVYGRGSGPFSRTSVQIPALIRGALKLDQAFYVGKGLSLWNGVHVEDLAALFLILMQDALANGSAVYGRDGLYYCPTDAFEWKQLANEIGQRLHAQGALSTAQSRSLEEEEKSETLGAWADFAYGSNSRSMLGKAPKTGWKPKYGEDSTGGGLFESIDAEYEAVLIEGKDQKAKVHFDELYNLSISGQK